MKEKGKFISNKKNAIKMWLRKECGSALRCKNIYCKGESKNFVWVLKPNYYHEHKKENYHQLCKICQYI